MEERRSDLEGLRQEDRGAGTHRQRPEQVRKGVTRAKEWGKPSKGPEQDGGLHKVQTLYIEILGDMISGIIHVNNRIQACENVIGSTVVATEMLSKFVYEMSKVVPQIKLVYCVGNHGRVNADIKESLNEENFEYLIKYYIFNIVY